MLFDGRRPRSSFWRKPSGRRADPRRLLWVLCLAASLGLVPGLAQAEQSSVVVEVKGSAKAGRVRLTRELRRRLADGLGGLQSSRKFRSAQKKLRIPPLKRTYPSQLARAARKIDATHIVFVRIERQRKKRMRYKAKAYILSAEAGAIMHQTTRSYASSKKAKGVGASLAKELLPVLERLLPQPEAPAIAQRETPRPASNLPELALPQKSVPKPEDSPEATAALEPASEAAPQTDQSAPVESVIAAEPQRERPSSEAAGHPIQFWVGPSLILHRDAIVSNEVVVRTSMSHTGSMMPGADLGLRVRFSEKIPLAVQLRGQVSVMHFDIRANGQALQPSGTLARGHLDLQYRAPVGGSDSNPIELSPHLGVVMDALRVDRHPGLVVPSYLAMGPSFGLDLSLPFADNWDFDLGIAFGYLLSYEETNGNSGENGGGVSLDAAVAVRWWLSPLIGLKLGLAANLNAASFNDNANRGHLSSEPIRNLDVNILELNSNLAVVVSL